METASASIRRARPLLGTFVEIAVAGTTIPAMEAAVEAAFAAVAMVHGLMSFHEPDSDVSRLNRGAASGAVRVHDWTYQVLDTACELHRRSAGMFDVAVAPALQKLGMLPRAISPPPCGEGSGVGVGERGTSVPQPHAPTPTLSQPKPRIRGFRPAKRAIEIGNSRFRLGGEKRC